MDKIKHESLSNDLMAVSTVSYPHMTKDSQRQYIRSIESRLKEIDQRYNISYVDDMLPERGAIKRLKSLLRKKK